MTNAKTLIAAAIAAVAANGAAFAQPAGETLGLERNLAGNIGATRIAFEDKLLAVAARRVEINGDAVVADLAGPFADADADNEPRPVRLAARID